MRLPITAIILTYNEEVNLRECLESIKDWVSGIIIIDSFSSDGTLEIAKEFGAVIKKREFKNQGEQFNWALKSIPIKTEWILRLDADERMTEKLWVEIEGAILRVGDSQSHTSNRADNPADAVNGFYLRRKVYFMGRWIRYGGYYPSWFLRLFRKGKARYEEREVDEHMVLLEGKARKLENGDFIDDNNKNLEWWIGKHNDYSSKEARERVKATSYKRQATSGIEGQVARKKRFKSVYLRLPLFFRSFAYFIYRYFFRLGFLDGKEGLIFHFLQGCWNQFLVDAKLYEYEKRDNGKRGS